jgi:hypothetical protein
MMRSRGFGCLLFLAGMPCALATPPALFSQPAYESPVRADPGDLLQLVGSGLDAGDVVVYQVITYPTQLLTPPAAIPSLSDSSKGTATVVSVADAPNSITVKLPAVLQVDVAYALWVQNSYGEWSNPVSINDARPLWISPDSAYATASTASLPRQLKVIGRNLQPAPGAVTQVRLHGPADFVLQAANDNDPTTTIERYVAKINLPDSLPTGSYSVEVSRDGLNWVDLDGMPFTVLPDPMPLPKFKVRDFGCLPGDGIDDTACVTGAIAAAKSNGGGTVWFGVGVWDLNYTGALNNAGPVTPDGILVPVGVNLSGAGAQSTIVRRGTGWNATTVTFTLQGNNTVQGITFQDANVYTPASNAGAMLRLGVRWNAAHLYSQTDPTTLSSVTITNNTFDRPFVAISNGGMPVDHLLVTYNDFGAYSNDVLMTGDGNNVDQPFRIDDSVFLYNTFEPGSYINPSTGQGVIATQLGAGRHLDFSSNVTDGTSTNYLYDRVNDSKGWRAAHFWSDRGNQSEILVSQNVATCTGDKAGDGEAIATDGSTFTDGLAAIQQVTGASANTVVIPGPLLLQQTNKTLPGGYFVGHWVQITSGTGKGQLRRIVSYPLDSSGQPLQPVVFNVSPAWDVIPDASSTVAVSREYWQFYIIDNQVDQRQPTCTKGNQTRPSGGGIGFYGQTSDSVMEGNVQHDTSGLSLGAKYSVTDTSLNTVPAISLYSFVDVRNNIVDGEYDYPSACSWGGIQEGDGASPTTGYTPPVEDYGVMIAHNTINRADGLHGGAIALTRGWFGGPSPGTWDLEDSTLIFGNTITNVAGPASTLVSGPLAYTTSPYKVCSNDSVARMGIHPGDPTVWHTVSADNSCTNVTTGFVDTGTGTQRVCPSTATSSCECPAAAAAAK